MAVVDATARVPVDALVGEYRESSDSRWLAVAYLGAQCSPDVVMRAANAALADGGASVAHRRAARELRDLVEAGLCRG